MEYFKDENDDVFAYDKEQIESGLADDKTALTYEEAEAIANKPLTDEQIQEQKNNEARQYLDSTDWYIIRHQENGKAIPQEILDAREEARNSII